MNRNVFVIANTIPTEAVSEEGDTYTIGRLTATDIHKHYKVKSYSLRTTDGLLTKSASASVMKSDQLSTLSLSCTGDVFDAEADIDFQSEITRATRKDTESLVSMNSDHRSGYSGTAEASTSMRKYSEKQRYTPTAGGIYIPARQKKKTPGKIAAAKISRMLAATGDIWRIRLAEMVILKEEERYGTFSRDPKGRLMPMVIARQRVLAFEIRKDDYRELKDAAHSPIALAPHAVLGGVGVISEAERIAFEELQGNLSVNAMDKLGDDNCFKREQMDRGSNSRWGGEDKVGGKLAPVDVRASESRARRPIRPNLSGDMESSRLRQRMLLTDKLADIERLRLAVVAQRDKLALLDKGKDKVNKTPSLQRSYSQSSSRSTRRTSPGRSTRFSSNERNTQDEINEGREELFTPPFSQSQKSQKQHYSSSDTGDDNNSGSSSNSSSQYTRPLRHELRLKVPLDCNSFIGVAVKQSSRSRLLSALAAARSSTSPNNSSSSSPLLAHTTSPKQPTVVLSSDGRTNNRVMGVCTRPSFMGPLGPILSLEELELRFQEQTFANDVIKIEHQLNRMDRFDSELACLKREERSANTLDKAREMERKRRLLGSDQGLTRSSESRGPDVLDLFVSRIQALGRGFIARNRLIFNKIHEISSSLHIQRIVRGGLSRCQSRKQAKDLRSAVLIQTLFRGWFVRVSACIVIAFSILFFVIPIIDFVDCYRYGF